MSRGFSPAISTINRYTASLLLPNTRNYQGDSKRVIYLDRTFYSH